MHFLKHSPGASTAWSMVRSCCSCAYPWWWWMQDWFSLTIRGCSGSGRNTSVLQFPFSATSSSLRLTLGLHVLHNSRMDRCPRNLSLMRGTTLGGGLLFPGVITCAGFYLLLCFYFNCFLLKDWHWSNSLYRPLLTFTDLFQTRQSLCEILIIFKLSRNAFISEGFRNILLK